MAIRLVILLRRRLSPSLSAFRSGQNLASLRSAKGGWAVHLGNVGLNVSWNRFVLTFHKYYR